MSAYFENIQDMMHDPIGEFDKALRREIKRRETACYEELAQVIAKYFPDVECTGRSLRDRLNQLLTAEEKLRRGDCTRRCANYPTCIYNQGQHGIVRINCPLWRPKG